MRIMPIMVFIDVSVSSYKLFYVFCYCRTIRTVVVYVTVVITSFLAIWTELLMQRILRLSFRIGNHISKNLQMRPHHSQLNTDDGMDDGFISLRCRIASIQPIDCVIFGDPSKKCHCQ